ncbi:hypothetical protein DPMN_055473 [Dreissena polymorpha]|uniref:Uncharacterized protein n=1 Tax=Dreissena polymorpha TaxID=45954 RepID=A0A9D4CSR9_DREPO|nr:hypothetical protein DPMN_055473 [Dreissena polymorpha]
MVDKPIKDKIKKTLWSLCVLVPLTGVSWILGIFFVNESASFMHMCSQSATGSRAFISSYSTAV